MIKPNPFKDAEVNPEPSTRDWQDYAELFFGFLGFYHKTIIGLVLLTILGVWSYHLTTDQQEIVEREESPTNIRPKKDDIPLANLNFVLKSKMDAAHSEEPNRPTTEPTAELRKPRKIQILLETGTVNELVEQSLKIHESWGDAMPSVGLAMCSERAKISRRLLEMDLSDSQRTFALASYIESISLIDSLNVASKMNILGTREALLEIDERFSNHPDPTIYAKANLAMTLAPLYDFIATSNVESLYSYQTQFQQRIEKIAPDQASLSRLAELSVAMHNQGGLPKERDPVILDLLTRMFDLKTPLAQEVAARFRQRLLFDRFEPKTLADVVQFNDEGVRKKVHAFFQTLAENPNSSQQIYKVAINVISSYQANHRIQDAEALLVWLEEISNQIPAEQNRQAVQDAISKLRAK